MGDAETTRPHFMLEVPIFIQQDYGAPIRETRFGAYLPKTTPPAMRLNAKEFTVQIAINNARWKPAVAASGFTGDCFSIR